MPSANSANGSSIRLSTERDSTPDRRDISRERSYESKRIQYQKDVITKAYPNMRKGFNCSASYNPAANKVCTKCPFISGHHEINCKNILITILTDALFVTNITIFLLIVKGF